MESATNDEHMWPLGDAWIHAVQAKDFDQLAEYCQPEVAAQTFTPFRQETWTRPEELIAKYQKWFTSCDRILIEQSRINPIGKRLGIFYRLYVHEPGSWYHIEQQLYITLKDGLVEKLQLLCSGFQPVEAAVENQDSQLLPGSKEVHPLPDASLNFDAGAVEAGSTCAMLTPAIKARLREMASGQLLEVRVNDPAARGDVESWSRLSGNKLVEMAAGDGQELRFVLQKK